MGFDAAFRARMLSRSADFLDGFSMVGRFPGTGGAGGAALGEGAFRVSVLDGFVLDGLVFFVLAMGSLGISDGKIGSGPQGLGAAGAHLGERVVHEGGHPAPAPGTAEQPELGTRPHADMQQGGAHGRAPKREIIIGFGRRLKRHVGNYE